MQVLKKVATHRLKEGMIIAHEIFDITGSTIANEGDIVTKELKKLLTKNFVEEAYVYIERQGLEDGHYKYIDGHRVRTDK